MLMASTDSTPVAPGDEPCWDAGSPAMARVLEGLRHSHTIDTVTSSALYDDLEAVLDEYADPAPDDIPELEERYLVALRRLVPVVLYRSLGGGRDEAAGELVTRAKAALRDRPKPLTLGPLRRTASLLLDVLDWGALQDASAVGASETV